jgi:predicted Zn-dependent protease
VPGRLLVAAASLAIAAGLGLGVYQARNQQAAERALSPPKRMSPARERRVADELDRAGTLNPGGEPEIDRGILALVQHRPRRAARVLLRAARSEPDNIAAWAWLLNAAHATRDARLVRLARARIVALRPLGVRPT